VNRDEHLAWAKDRALEYADQGDVALATASLISDLGKHKETSGHAGIQLMMMEATAGMLNTPQRLRECIEGFR
jgi:hypothetical protein